MNEVMKVFEDQVIGFEAMILGEAKKEYEQELERKKRTSKKASQDNQETITNASDEDPFKYVKEGLISTASAFKYITKEKILADPKFAEQVMLPHKSYTRMIRYIMKNASKYAFRVPAPKGQNSVPMGMFVANDDFGYKIVEEYYLADDIKEVEEEIAAEKAWIEKQAKLAEERKAKEAAEADLKEEAERLSKEELEQDPEYVALSDDDKAAKLKSLTNKKFYDLKRKREARENAKKKREAKKEQEKKKKPDSKNDNTKSVETIDNSKEETSNGSCDSKKTSTEETKSISEPKDDSLTRQAVQAKDQQMTLWDFISM